MSHNLKLQLFALALVIAALMFTPASAAQRIVLMPDPEARASSFLWWRIEKGKVADSGSCHPGQMTAQQNDMRSSDGTLIRMFAQQFVKAKAVPASEPALPDLDRAKRYYSAVDPETGYVIAQEHHAGETWVFQIGDRIIVSSRGFTAAQSTSVKLHCKSTRGKSREIELGGPVGFWTYGSTNGVSDCAIGLGVAGCAELDKQYMESSGQLLRLPSDRGLIAIRSPKPGDRWSCTVDGKTYAIPPTKHWFSTLARAEIDDYDVRPRDGVKKLPLPQVAPDLPPDETFIPDGEPPLLPLPNE